MNRILSLVLFLYSVSAYSQPGTFPLGIGNRWDYGVITTPGNFEIVYSVSITGDTIMPNGKTYAIERSTTSAAIYRRQDGQQIYQYVGNGTETLIYDYSRRFGDTIAVHYATDDTLFTASSNGHGYVFGITQWIWSFYTFSKHHSFYRNVQIADNVGIIEIDSTEQPNIYLVSANINGVEYSSILNDVYGVRSFPKNFELAQNYPNPFNPTTRIHYEIPERSFVSLKVYAISGKEIRTLVGEEQPTGSYTIRFNADGLASGVYFYRLSAGRLSRERKFILVK